MSKVNFVELYKNSRLFENEPDYNRNRKEDKRQRKLERLKKTMKGRRKRNDYYKRQGKDKK